MSSPTNWAGKLVRKYGPSIINPNPSEGTIAELIPFQSKQYRPGEGYFVDVVLAHEQGVTRAVDHAINTLNSAIDSIEKQANLEGSEIHLRGRLSYGMIAKLESGIYGGGVESKMASLMTSGENHREADLLYGPGTSGLASLGTINTIVSGGAGASVVVTLTQATWAGGMWPQFLNAEFDAYSAGGAQSNATTALILTAVSSSNCRLTFTKTAGDTLSAGDLLFFRGARVKSCVGLQGIAENTGSLFGISASQYAQWKSVSYAVGGALSFDKVIEGASQLSENGLEDGLTLLVGHRAWADLMNDEASLRRYTDGKYTRKAAPGFEDLEFHSSCGVLRVRKHRFLKQGIALGVPTQDCERVGSTDLTFGLPGAKGSNEIFSTEISDASGREIRLYSDQGVFCHKPWHMIEFTGITSTGDTAPS